MALHAASSWAVHIQIAIAVSHCKARICSCSARNESIVHYTKDESIVNNILIS